MKAKCRFLCCFCACECSEEEPLQEPQVSEVRQAPDFTFGKASSHGSALTPERSEVQSPRAIESRRVRTEPQLSFDSEVTDQLQPTKRMFISQESVTIKLQDH